jgi:hypothetical protein
LQTSIRQTDGQRRTDGWIASKGRES